MQNQINKCVEFLQDAKIILYPSDTIWGLGCDATNREAISNIYAIKQRKTSKSLIVLVDSIEMLKKYVETVPEMVIDYLSEITEPTTVIYNNPINLTKNLIADDNTIAIRVVNKGFVYDLIKIFNKPIVSTSANISGKKTPKTFSDISAEIKNDVDFIVEYKITVNTAKSSKIVRFVNNNIEVLRN